MQVIAVTKAIIAVSAILCTHGCTRSWSYCLMCPSIPAIDGQTHQALQNINILFYLISRIFCLILYITVSCGDAVCRPAFLNKRRCDECKDLAMWETTMSFDCY